MFKFLRNLLLKKFILILEGRYVPGETENRQPSNGIKSVTDPFTGGNAYVSNSAAMMSNVRLPIGEFFNKSFLKHVIYAIAPICMTSMNWRESSAENKLCKFAEQHFCNFIFFS